MTGDDADTNWNNQFLRLISDGDGAAALRLMNTNINPMDDFSSQMRYVKLLKKVGLENFNNEKLKIALLAESTVDHFTKILALWLQINGIDAEIRVLDFDTIKPTIINFESELYKFNPDVVWIMPFSGKIGTNFPPDLNQEQTNREILATAEEWLALWKILGERLSCLIFHNNCDLPFVQPLGNIEGSLHWGRTHILRRYNLHLSDIAPDGVVIFDIEQIASEFGTRNWFDPRLWQISKIAFSFDAFGIIAHRFARLLVGARGGAIKCIVLDLDNTLWGGVIGDDGVGGIALGNSPTGEAFVSFQHYLKILGERGIILAVCSKNDPEQAVRPFLERTDCVLKLSDFSAFVANWNNKADNVRDIVKTLNIGLDAVLFVDDNPAEREIIRSFLPEVHVANLPADPSEYITCINSGRYFETIGHSKEDLERKNMYRANAERTQLAQSYTDMSKYLIDLKMTATVGTFDEVSKQRLLQLINKTNQFNLNATRTTEVELENLAKQPDITIRHYSLADNFGDNGLVSVIVLRHQDRALIIDCWVMSCRVFSRTLEEFILDDIIHLALHRGCTDLIGTYTKSKKNAPVLDLYPRLGFIKSVNKYGTTVDEVFYRNANDMNVPISYITRQDIDS